MNLAKVSVIIPVYGVEKYIRRCAESLFCQTLKEVEFIFVDDYTPDASVDILKQTLNSYPESASKVKIIHHSRNRGSAAARNTALSIASGEYITVIDGDDYVEPTMLEDMYNLAVSEKADIVTSDYWIDYKDKVIYKKQITPTTGVECLKELLEGKFHASTSNKLVSLKLFVENGIIHVEGLNFSEDMSVLFRLFYCARKVAYCPHAYLHYVQYNNSSYTKKIVKKSRKNMMDVVVLVNNHFIANKVVNDDLWKAFAYYKLSVKSILLFSCDSNERREYFDIYNEAMPYLPTHPTLPIYHKWAVEMAFKHKSVSLSVFLNIFNIARRIMR